MSNISEFLTLFAIFSFCSRIIALPEDIQRCKIEDAKCLVKSANKVLWKYYGGIKEIDLAAFDPFYIESMKIVQDAGVVNVRATSNKTNVYGFSKGKIEKIGGFDKNFVDINFKAPKLNFVGLYSSVSKILGVSLNGAGTFNVNFNDFVATLKLNMTRRKDNGKTYFKVHDSKLSFDISGGEMDIPDQGYITNVFINASFDLIIKRSLVSVISEQWSKPLGKIISKLLKKVPVEDLFLP